MCHVICGYLFNSGLVVTKVTVRACHSCLRKIFEVHTFVDYLLLQSISGTAIFQTSVACGYSWHSCSPLRQLPLFSALRFIQHIHTLEREREQDNQTTFLQQKFRDICVLSRFAVSPPHSPTPHAASRYLGVLGGST